MDAAEYMMTGDKLCDRGRCDEALRVLREGLERFPRDAWLRTAYAKARLVAGDMPDAREAALAALKLDKDLELARVLLIESELYLGRRKRAVSRFVEAHEGEVSVDYLRSMGGVFMRHEIFDYAAACFCGTVKADPLCAEALEDLGLAMASLGRLKSARALLRRSLLLDPLREHAIKVLGDVCYELGDHPSALEAWRLIPRNRHDDLSRLRRFTCLVRMADPKDPRLPFLRRKISSLRRRRAAARKNPLSRLGF